MNWLLLFATVMLIGVVWAVIQYPIWAFVAVFVGWLAFRSLTNKPDASKPSKGNTVKRGHHLGEYVTEAFWLALFLVFGTMVAIDVLGSISSGGACPPRYC